MNFDTGVLRIFANREHGAQQGYNLAKSHAHLSRTLQKFEAHPFDTERPSGSKEHANAPSALACSLLLRDTDEEDRQLVQAGHRNAEDDRAVDVGPWCEKRCSNPHTDVSRCTFLF